MSLAKDHPTKYDDSVDVPKKDSNSVDRPSTTKLAGILQSRVTFNGVGHDTRTALLKRKAHEFRGIDFVRPQHAFRKRHDIG